MRCAVLFLRSRATLDTTVRQLKNIIDPQKPSTDYSNANFPVDQEGRTLHLGCKVRQKAGALLLVPQCLLAANKAHTQLLLAFLPLGSCMRATAMVAALPTHVRTPARNNNCSNKRHMHAAPAYFKNLCSLPACTLSWSRTLRACLSCLSHM